MSSQIAVRIGLLGFASALAFSVPAGAYSVSDTIDDMYGNSDIYYGAITPTNSPFLGNADIVSSFPTDTRSDFEIKRADATLVTSGNTLGGTASLTIKLYTNYYAGNLGTAYGDLFLSSAWTPINNDSHNTDDQLSNGTAWEYALVLANQNPFASDTTPNGAVLADLYATGGNKANIKTSYDGSLVCSPGNQQFRCGQPVEYQGGSSGAADTGINGLLTVSTLTGGDEATRRASADGLFLLEFVINDVSTLGFGNNRDGYSIALAWAMTCANDAIEGTFDFVPPPPAGTVPLPAAFPLFAFAVGGLGLAGRWRKRRAALAT